MKVSIEDLKGSAKEAGKEAAKEGAEQASKEQPATGPEFTIERYLEFKQKEQKLQEVLKQETGPSLSEQIADGLQALSKPEVQESLAKIWYGEPQQQQQQVDVPLEQRPKPKKGLETDGGQSDNQPRETDSNMLPDLDDNDSDEQTYKPGADHLHNMLTHMLRYYCEHRPDATAEQIAVDVACCSHMAARSAQMQPGMHPDRALEIAEGHEDRFKDELEQFIETNL